MSIIVAYQGTLFDSESLLHVRNADGSIEILTAGETLTRVLASPEPLVTPSEFAALCEHCHTQPEQDGVG